MILLLSSIGNVDYKVCHAGDRINISQAEEMVDNLNRIIENNREELYEEFVGEMKESDELDYDNQEQLDKFVDKNNSIEEKVEDVVEFLENNEEDEEVIEDIEQELKVSNVEQLENQHFINPLTGKEFESVEEVSEYLEVKGYEVDDEDLELCEIIEEIKEDSDSELPELIVEVNNQIIEEYDEKKWEFGINVSASNAYKEAYSQWTSLTSDEKALIICEPKKAIATKALTKKAFEMTQKRFGYNGLGDKSDGFRHGVWNALMTRDITRAWAKAYATAHESGKTKKQLEKKAADGYTEKRHREMDLHNNSIGRDVIKWYDTSINVSDSKLKKRIENKLTNNKSTGIYWLHK